MSILVLGVGNLLLKDEGVGVRVIEALAEGYEFPDNVELLDGGTAGMELLGIMGGRKQVIIVDAVKTGAAPGTVVRLAGDEVPAFFRTKISPHQVGLSDVLAALRLTGEEPGGVVVIGVVPHDLGTGLEMSAEITAKIPLLQSMVIDEVTRLGAAPKVRAVPG